MYRAYFASNLEEARKLNPASGDFVVLEGISPRMTEEWKDCEGSSLPEGLQSLKGQNAVLAKITEQKVKFFKFPEKKSICCQSLYHEALKVLIITD